jgi:hypothetical protein
MAEILKSPVQTGLLVCGRILPLQRPKKSCITAREMGKDLRCRCFATTYNSKTHKPKPPFESRKCCVSNEQIISLTVIFPSLNRYFAHTVHRWNDAPSRAPVMLFQREFGASTSKINHSVLIALWTTSVVRVSICVCRVA